MAGITQRERFLNTLLGGGSDRFPFFDLEPAEETLKRWRREGFPRWASFPKYFNLETHHDLGLQLRSYPFYGRASDLLHDPASFARHYNPNQQSRYARGFERRCKNLKKKGRIIYVDAWAGGLLQMLGVGDWKSFESACLALLEAPKLVEDLVQRTTDFYCTCLERVLSKVSVDYASFYEPIASNIGPVISPTMFKRFAIPGYKKVVDLLKRYEVPLRVFCTTGGDLTSLLPSLLEAGINALWISNIESAGMSYTRLRIELGDEVALIGGIDSKALLGSERSVKETVEKTLESLLHRGHYLPCLDDRPRSNIPFEKYRLYRQTLEEIAQSGKA